MSTDSVIYKITPRVAWEEAERKGQFEGAAIDLQDGYIHFSSADQVAETAAKHFAGQDDLLLVAVDAASLGDDLKWEVSRGGALFPHLYAHLSMTSVLWARAMPLSDDGQHTIPME
ncbi:MAG: DUF952 domain-containing protein [Rhizobiaceae bacterium]|nr:DUF952 domain-containing protein [Hyphomicrobiales bacterium]NRB30339.1 DUF952 domain-containing protein [Rhizobiaceae bacterium]